MGSEMMGKTSGEKQGVSLTTRHAKPIFLRLFARLSSPGHSCLAPARADRVGQALGRLLFLSPGRMPSKDLVPTESAFDVANEIALGKMLSRRCAGAC